MTTPSDAQPDRAQSSSTGWPSDEPLPRPPVSEALTDPGPKAAAEPTPAAVQPAPAEPIREPVAAAVESDEAPTTRSRVLTLPVLALLLMTVLMAVATGWIWLQVHRHDQAEAARRAGLDASREAARVLFSYDYRTLDKDFAAGRALTTGAFAKQYADTTTKVVTDVAKQKKAVVKADVVNAGVVRASADQVVTIVFVNQVTTSTLLPAPKVDLSRVRMTLKHVGDRWLVSKVDAL